MLNLILIIFILLSSSSNANQKNLYSNKKLGCIKDEKNYEVCIGNKWAVERDMKQFCSLAKKHALSYESFVKAVAATQFNSTEMIEAATAFVGAAPGMQCDLVSEAAKKVGINAKLCQPARKICLLNDH